MAEPMTLDDWQSFFPRYEEFLRERTRLHLDKFKTRFGHMKTGLQSINKLSCELSKYRANAFNVFRLLKVERSEVTTHSVLLADLLNPQGTHSQHHLFLRTFLHCCAEKFGEAFPRLQGDIENAVWFVQREKVTSFGNLDLVLSCPDLHFLLVIENKIDAVEQENQLCRYAKWMESHKEYFAKRVLIYLTPQGVSSTTAIKDTYFSLSYRHDIYQWLHKSLVEVQSSRVKENIKQYLEIIKNL